MCGVATLVFCELLGLRLWIALQLVALDVFCSSSLFNLILMNWILVRVSETGIGQLPLANYAWGSPAYVRFGSWTSEPGRASWALLVVRTPGAWQLLVWATSAQLIPRSAFRTRVRLRSVPSGNRMFFLFARSFEPTRRDQSWNVEVRSATKGSLLPSLIWRKENWGLFILVDVDDFIHRCGGRRIWRSK